MKHERQTDNSTKVKWNLVLHSKNERNSIALLHLKIP